MAYKTPKNWNGCNNCFYLRSENNKFICPAYPENIPIAIASGNVPHLKIFPDQNGDTVWEQKNTKL